MPDFRLSGVAVEAMRLQNGYALAIDARDWELFRTVFTADVRADYPHGVFEGMEEWLGTFIPFHDTCAWTVHEITNHVVGVDGGGVWGTCYGWIRWTMKDTPGYINRAEVLFRDRLREDEAARGGSPGGRCGCFPPSRGRAFRLGTTWFSPCSTWPTGRSAGWRLRRFLLLSPCGTGGS